MSRFLHSAMLSLGMVGGWNKRRNFKKGYRLKVVFWPNLDAPKIFFHWAFNFSPNSPKYKMAASGLVGWVKKFFSKFFFSTLGFGILAIQE